MSYFDLYNKYISNLKQGRDADWVGSCPLGTHKDLKPSFSCNVDSGLYICFACGEKGNAVTFAKIVGEDHRPYFNHKGAKYPVVKKEKPKKYSDTELSEFKIKAERYHKTLNPNQPIFKGMKIGKDKNDAMTFPYHNEDLDIIGIKHHKAPSGKSPWWEGDGSLKWYGIHLLSDYDRKKPLIICEGEKDYLRLKAEGYQAICGSAGCGSTPALPKLFSEFQIIILYDNDNPGSIGAKKTGNAIKDQRMARSVKIAQWREGLPNGFDVWDDYTKNESLVETVYALKNSSTIRKGFKVNKMVDFKKEGYTKPKRIVQNILEEESLTVIGGTTGVGKSWLGLQLGCSIASGSPLFNSFDVPSPKKVLLVQFELTNGQLTNRFELMKPNFVDNVDLISKNFYAVALEGEKAFVNQWEEIRFTLKDLDFIGGVLIVDNLYTSTDINTSDNNEMMRLLSEIRQLMVDFKLAVMLVTHHNKSTDKEGELHLDQIQGGSQLTRFASNVFQMHSSMLGTDLRIAKITKVRDEECSLLYIPFKLYWETDKHIFTKGGIIENERLHFIEPKERWELKILHELSGYYEHRKMDSFDRHFVCAFVKWDDTSSNQKKITRLLKKWTDWGLVKKTAHNNYQVIQKELEDVHF